MQADKVYRADGLQPLVAISGDGRLESTLDEVMVGWGLIPAGDRLAGAVAEPALRVEQTADGWTCSGVTFDAPITYHDPVAASCSLIAHLFKAHTFEAGSGLCLHAAGVQVEEGVVLLTGAYRAGKSVVSAACAAAGLRVISDDIIPLTPDGRSVRAPGLAIRLRRPLPDSLAPETLAFLELHRVAASERYLYVRPPADRLARFGAQAPVRAVIVLDRVESGSAGLALLPPDDALRETIRRNFARAIPAGQILGALDGLVGRIPCLKLRYHRADEAADLLATRLDQPLREHGTGLKAPPPERPSSACPVEPGSELDPETRICRLPGAQITERSGELFLTDREDRTIFNLNATAAAVWNMAAEPTRFGTLVELFAAAFPDRSGREITMDLSKIVRRLARNGLLALEVEESHQPSQLRAER